MDEISKQDLEGPVIDRRTTMKLLGGMSAGAIGSVAGCLGQGNGGGTNGGGGGNSSSPASSAETGGKISAGLLTDKVNFLNPHLVTAATQIMIHANIFSGLTKINQKNQIVGDLAKDWSLPDETTYVFKLNEGVKFHNGDTLDAGAAKWSIEQLNTLDESPHKGKIAAIDSMEANGTELTIHLANPVGPFISFMTRGPGRAGTIVHRNAGKQPDKYNRQPIGSGPFELSKRSSGESLTLSKFENYWETDDDGNQLPYLDEINVQLIPEPNTMWSAITSDSIDHTMEISGEFASQARNRPDLQVQSAGAGEYQGVRLLASKPSSHDPKLVQQSGGPQTVSGEWKGKNLPTSDPKVRRALAMAIDREEIIEKGYFGFAVPAHSPYNPTMDWVYEKEPDPGQYHDPEQSKQLLDKAGYRGSPRFKASLAGRPKEERVMTIIQQQLSNVGVEVELNIIQPSVYWSGEGVRSFKDMLGMVVGIGDVDPYMSHWRQFGTPGKMPNMGSAQFSLWFHDEYDKLIMEDYRTAKQKDRKQVLRDSLDILMEEAPIAMTVFPTLPRVTNQKLKNVGIQAGLNNFHRAYLTN